MATHRPLAVPQDENDVTHGHRVKFDGSNEGLSFPSGKGLGGARAGGGAFSKTPGKGLASGRKALGDISNRTSLGKSDLLGKTPGAGGGKLARRVLGDITNATPAQQLEPAAAKAAPAPPQATMAARPRAETYADGGIERRAGKGWQQLETERLQREGATVEAQVRNVVLPWAARRLASQDLSLAQLVQRRSAALEREPVPPCPPSPPMPASPLRTGDFGIAFPASGAQLADLLPKVADAALMDELAMEDADGD